MKIICKPILLIILTLSQIYVNAQSITYHLDVKQSKLFWKGTKTIGKTHVGFLLFNSGWIHTNAAGKLNDGMFSMNMNSIKSTEHENEEKNKGVEKELKGNAFFESSKYPTSSIVVKSIFPTIQPTQFKIEGSLTIKSTTHPIVFFAIIKQNGNTLKATANLTIDRSKWGIHQNKSASVSDQFFAGIKDKMIADEIPIALNLVFVKKH